MSRYSSIPVHVNRCISIGDLNESLTELTCSNRTTFPPHEINTSVHIKLYVHGFYIDGQANVRFTNPQRREFIRVAKTSLEEYQKGKKIDIVIDI